jgi:hypothetical protein
MRVGILDLVSEYPRTYFEGSSLSIYSDNDKYLTVLKFHWTTFKILFLQIIVVYSKVPC